MTSPVWTARDEAGGYMVPEITSDHVRVRVEYAPEGLYRVDGVWIGDKRSEPYARCCEDPRSRRANTIESLAHTGVRRYRSIADYVCKARESGVI